MKVPLIFSIYIFLLSPWPSLADVISLDRYISEPSSASNADALLAFQVNNNCTNWKYIPGSLVTSGRFLHDTALTTTNVGGQKLLGYVTSLDLTVGPRYNQSDIDRLRELIYQFGQTDSDCKGKITSADAIVMTPALVQSLAGAGVAADDGTAYFSKIYPTYGRSDQDSYRNPFNPISMTYILDATDPSTPTRLRQLEQSSRVQATHFGNLLYSLEGITARVNSHIRQIGEMTAKFNSDVKKTHCSVSSDAATLSPAAAAAAVVGAGIPGVLGASEDKTSCEFNLVTEFKGGSYRGIFSVDHSDSQFDVMGKPIMYVTCTEKGVCNQIPLANFVEFRLYTDFLSQSFDVIIKKMTDNTFDVTLGRQGDVKTSINVDVSYLRNFNGKIALQVPIYAQQLDSKSFRLDWLDTSFYDCITAGYYSQAEQYSEYLQEAPMPVMKACHFSNKGY